MSRRALSLPNEGTAPLNQLGSAALLADLNATSRPHRPQSRSGSPQVSSRVIAMPRHYDDRRRGVLDFLGNIVIIGRAGLAGAVLRRARREGPRFARWPRGRIA